MQSLNPKQKLRLAELERQVRRASPDEAAEAAAKLFAVLVPTLPRALRQTPIEIVRWSQPFATNGWWRRLWNHLEVAIVDDLAAAAHALAHTRSVGRVKLLSLIRDLKHLAARPESAAEPDPHEDRIAIIRRCLQAIEKGTPSPPPRLVKLLLANVIEELPARLRNSAITALPWKHEWCYLTPLWRELGVRTVADLGPAAPELARARGIGRGKVLMLARELIFFCPDLHARVRAHPASARRSAAARHPEPGARPLAQAQGENHAARAGGLVAAIDRLAERHDGRERDILQRRIGWRYGPKPETLRVLADDHGVSQERIRQIENQLRKRLLAVLTVRGTSLALASALRNRHAPADLRTIIACDPAEWSGMMEVWQPIASLLAAQGGPFLVEDAKHPGRVCVIPGRGSRTRSTKEHDRRLARAAKRPLSCPTTCPSSQC